MSIERIKSLISKKGGLAKANRFNVMFTPPDLTLFNLDLQGLLQKALTDNLNPKNVLNGAGDISLLCDSVSMLDNQLKYRMVLFKMMLS